MAPPLTTHRSVPAAPYIRDSDGTVGQGESLPANRVPVLDVADPTLTFIRIDHQSRLQFGGTEFVIASAFRLTMNDADYELDPDGRSGLGPLLALYPDELVTARVDPDSALRLSFASGAELVVPPSDEYEAWEVNGPGNRVVVCQPGGELSVWS